jgi:hypothetical protein
MRMTSSCAFLTLVLAIGYSAFSGSSGRWRIAPDAPLLTRWAKQVDPDRPLPEYPRPQMVRHEWLNLNGLWEYEGDTVATPLPIGRVLAGRILVPFPVESALSGVSHRATHLWYRRAIRLPKTWKGMSVLLHFGAVDWETKVFVNGTQAGEHRGGYDPFTMDITPLLRAEDTQEILVGVYDPSDAGDQPRGKQVRKPGGIWYTACTGIWQTVWCEPVPPNHVEDIQILPDLDHSSITVRATVPGAADGDSFRVSIREGKKNVSLASGPVSQPLVLPVAAPRVWSPESPFLYDITITISRSGRIIDRVESYTGMRSVGIGRDERGIQRLLLNGKPYFQVGPLDQGFWPDGIYTAPTDAALRSDIEMTRKLGFNMTRKHVKVEPARWYYWADRLGLLVWQDMPSANNTTPESRKQFETELTRLVETHRQFPSIVMWVVFNEGWGQYDTERLTSMVKRLDPARLVNNASGWTDKNSGDVMDVHSYPRPHSAEPESARAVVLGEFGGLGLALPGHTWNKEHWGYQGMADSEELIRTYEGFLRDVYELKDETGLAAAVYTQLTDVELECNGVLTYDRKKMKPPLERFAYANRGNFSLATPQTSVRTLVPTSAADPQWWKYTTRMPSGNWMDPAFDDRSWLPAPGGFGKTGNAAAVVRTPWDTASIWMRRGFVLDDPIPDSIALVIFHDDDAEIYLNGVLAAQFSRWTSDYSLRTITPQARAALRPGRNILSVHCSQKRGGQYIDVGLAATTQPIVQKKRTGIEVVRASVHHQLIAGERGSVYPGNRAPLVPSPFVKLPIGAITPRGWLRTVLEEERDGMVGRLREISPWLDRSTSAWANRQGTGSRGWEELPYWLKGFGDLGYVLGDTALQREARVWIDGVLDSQREDGWFGPRELLTSLDGKPDLWPHMVMLNILQAFSEATGDGRVIPFMTRYFRWQDALPPQAFGAGYWPRLRMGDNIESALWLYNRTGDRWLLHLVKEMHEQMARWDTDVINWHNVNVAQGFRAPAVYYQAGRDVTLLNAAERNYRKVRSEYGQFPGGGFAADENARPGFFDPRQGFETCGIVEFMHSFEMLTKIGGSPVWADRCEELAFNSLPAAMTPDQRALHYLTCANQVQLDKGPKTPGIQNGGIMFSYSPFQVYRCCQHNVGHGWPYFAEEIWLATWDGGLCASLYAPSEARVRVGKNGAGRVTVIQETGYPFDGTIRLTIGADQPVRFPLYLRVPAWCESGQVRVNGTPVEVQWSPQAYLRIERIWSAGDTVNLTLDMPVRVKVWEKNKNAVSVSRGPLFFSLQIDERWERYGSDSTWAEWEVFPASPWNYGLVLNPDGPERSFTVKARSTEPLARPWTVGAMPVVLTAAGRRIEGWQQDYRGLIGPLQGSPAWTDAPVEQLTFIPMGAARLRVTAFPTTTTDSSGVKWVPPARPRPIAHAITYSYVNRYDDSEAVADGFEPKSSNDEAVPRMTWWAHLGTREWVQYDFPREQEVATSAVYWYDDGEESGCRVPASWRVLIRKGDVWQPVVTQSAYGVSKDTFNRVEFEPVKTNGIRLEVQLQPKYSGGILEWKVGP